MLKFRRTHTYQDVLGGDDEPRGPPPAPPTRNPRLAASPNTRLDRNSSFVSSQLGYSKATVVLRNVSLPLAWPADEYFGNKREFREFTLQLVLRSADGSSNRELFSTPKEHINRTYTDVEFPNEEFAFYDQSPRFCIELCLYCKRTDPEAQPTGAQLVHSLTRSLSKGVGDSLKRMMRGGSASRRFSSLSQASGGGGWTREEFDFIEKWRNPERMYPLATAKFRLKNATLSGRTHTYNMDVASGNDLPSRSQLLPIYGSICAQLLVQPASLVDPPLAEGRLDLFYVEGGILLQKQHCQLKGGSLRCWVQQEREEVNGLRSSAPSLNLNISDETLVESTAFPTALRLKLPDGRHFLLIGGSQRSYLGWKNALALQILDCSIWADFSLFQKNPHGARFVVLDGKSRIQTAAETTHFPVSVSEPPTEPPGDYPTLHFSTVKDFSSRMHPSIHRSSTMTPADSGQLKFHYRKATSSVDQPSHLQPQSPLSLPRSRPLQKRVTVRDYFESRTTPTIPENDEEGPSGTAPRTYITRLRIGDHRQQPQPTQPLRPTASTELTGLSGMRVVNGGVARRPTQLGVREVGERGVRLPHGAVQIHRAETCRELKNYHQRMALNARGGKKYGAEFTRL